MSFKNKNNHMIDIIFVIALFCLFAISALMLVIIGANVYKKTITDMDTNYVSRTSFSYVSEKLRQHDVYDGIHIDSYGDSDAILLTEIINKISYTTYLYLYNGYLMELFTRSDQQLSPNSGQRIIKMDAFHINKINDSLYEFYLESSDNEKTTLVVSSHCS